ncbi:MAG: polysaccharide pyruvyl transferase family protein, partial [Nitriliruptoraceae bacterium]
NLGDELVFAGLRRLLADQGAELAAISLDPAATRRTHGVGAVAHTDAAGIWRALGQADALVFGGGGLLQDTTSPFNLPYHLARPVLARLRAVPVVGLGLGAGALDTRLGRAQVRAVTRRFDGLTVRDRQSQDLLARLGVPDVRLGADLAYALAPADLPGSASDGTLVVCLRPWSGQRGRLPAAARGDQTPQPQVEVLAAGLDRIAQQTGLKVRFVALQADRDDALHARVAAAMRSPSSRATPTLLEVLAEVAAATAVVSMRYHGGVAAVLAGRPVVLVDYAAKVASLAEDLGPAARLLAWDPQALTTLPEALTEVLPARDDLLAARERLLSRHEVTREALADLALTR